MTIPASRRPKRDTLQRARQRRGDEWEKELCNELQRLGWARRWPKAWAGQPFDISAVIDGISYAIECKRVLRGGNLAFSQLRPNEVKNLSRHEDAGGISVVAIQRDEPFTRRFVPWREVREPIEKGLRGSIRIQNYPADLKEVKQIEG